MKVTILGHASLFFEAGDERILLDPVLRTTPLMGGLVHQYPRALDLERMPEPTLLVITHAHFDHYDFETLRRLRKDIPVIVPPDKRMARELTALGFSNLQRLDTWQTYQHGALRLCATPSDAPVVELGLLVETEQARVWHMSDAEASCAAAKSIVSERGPVDVLSAKFQPADPQLNYQHNLGASFDRAAVASWLEAGACVAPKLVFPYASGLCFEGAQAWLNRYSYPFSPEHVANLLGRRLGASSSVCTVRPGDVLTIANGAAVRHEQASPFVAQAREEIPTPWEPFDAERMDVFVGESERDAFRRQLDQLVPSADFIGWLQRHSSADGVLKAFREWQVICQLVVHLGAGQRAEYVLDFSADLPSVARGTSIAANYFTHVGGRPAQRLLEGAITPLEVMLQGDARIYDRIIAVHAGEFAAPTTTRLYEQFPDPLLTFGGMRRRARRAQREQEAATAISSRGA